MTNDFFSTQVLGLKALGIGRIHTYIYTKANIAVIFYFFDGKISLTNKERLQILFFFFFFFHLEYNTLIKFKRFFLVVMLYVY